MRILLAGHSYSRARARAFAFAGRSASFRVVVHQIVSFVVEQVLLALGSLTANNCLSSYARLYLLDRLTGGARARPRTTALTYPQGVLDADHVLLRNALGNAHDERHLSLNS